MFIAELRLNDAYDCKINISADDLSSAEKLLDEPNDEVNAGILEWCKFWHLDFDTVEYEVIDVYAEEPRREEDDYCTEDHHNFYQNGKLVVEVPEGEEWEPYIREHMEKEGFFPSVWFISDHGNEHLLDSTR